MHKALKTLVLLFAAALVVTALTQPASAHYDEWAPKTAGKAKDTGVNLKQLALELRRKLGLLREALLMREKLDRDRISRPACAGNKCEMQRPEVPEMSTEGQVKKPGVMKTLLHNEYVKYLRRKVKEIVFAHIRPRPQAVTVQQEREVAPVTEKNRATQGNTPEAKSLQKRIDALRVRLKSTLESNLKSRLESAAKSAPAPKKVETQPQRREKPSAPQVQTKLRNELLRQLREKFQRELDKKTRELKREVESKGHTRKRRSAWF
jgi:hypothetical protein